MNKKRVLIISFSILILLAAIFLLIKPNITGNVIANSGSNYSCENCNLLIIVSDALRADKINCNSTEVNTPNICRLAEQGVLFENAYSNAPWTIPSSISIFTGQYPRVHFKGKEKEYEKSFYVNNQKLLLAEALNKKGYITKYHVENGLLKKINVLQGFSEVNKAPQEFRENNPQIHKTNWDFLYDLETTIKQGEKFYYLKWFIDPHDPYNPPKDLKKEINVDESKLTYKKEFYSSTGIDCPKGPNCIKIDDVAPKFNKYELKYLKALYEKEIEFVDERVGRILDLLEKYNQKNNTIIIFTSDHGESFGEKGFFKHGHNYYNQEIHIPLIISAPKIPKNIKIKDFVQHLDLTPTIKDILNIDCIKDAQGKSYKPLLVGGGSEKREIYISSSDRNYQKNAMIIKGDKLINIKPEKTEFYRILEDPEELDNLSKDNPTIIEKILSTIKKIIEINHQLQKKEYKERNKEEVEKASQETLEQLKALGYMT